MLGKDLLLTIIVLTIANLLNFTRNTFFRSIDNLGNYLIKALEAFKKHKSESNFSLICFTDAMSVFHFYSNMNENREAQILSMFLDWFY